MTDLTVIPNVKVDAREHDIVISNEQALIIVCRACGNIRTISLHENPTEAEMAPEGRLSTGIVQHLGFSSCQCNAPNHGGVLRDVKAALKTCTTKEEIERLLDSWIAYADRERKR